MRVNEKVKSYGVEWRVLVPLTSRLAIATRTGGGLPAGVCLIRTGEGYRKAVDDPESRLAFLEKRVGQMERKMLEMQKKRRDPLSDMLGL